MQSRKRIIAFAGRNGSGKETAAARTAAALEAPHHTYSDVLVETFRIWGVDPSSRPQQQALSTSMRGILGEDALAKVIEFKCGKAATDHVVIDGVRRLTDVENMLHEYGSCFILIWIEAAAEIRYARLKLRKEKKGETMMSWEEFLKQESAESENQLEDVRRACQMEIDNNGTLAELEAQVDNLILDLKTGPVAYG